MTLQTDEQAASLRPADIWTPMYCEIKAWAPSMSLCAADWSPAPPRKPLMRPVNPPSCDSSALSVPRAALPTLAICVAQVLTELVDDVTGAEVDVVDGTLEISCVGSVRPASTISAPTSRASSHERQSIG